MEGRLMPEQTKAEAGEFLGKAYKLWAYFYESPKGPGMEKLEAQWWDRALEYIQSMYADYCGADSPIRVGASMVLFSLLSDIELRNAGPKGLKEIDHWRMILRLLRTEGGPSIEELAKTSNAP